MNQSGNTPEGTSYSEWVKNQAEAWEAICKQSAQWLLAPLGGIPPAGQALPRLPEEWTAFLSAVQQVMTLAAAPKPSEVKSAKSTADLVMKGLQPLWGIAVQLQRQWMQATGQTAIPGEQENIAQLTKEMTRAWYEAQGDDLRKILNIPALGLTRLYQEHYNRAAEKAMDFQSALTEFFQLLLIPLEKAYYTVQEEVARLQKEGKDAAKDSRSLYQLWIGKLEEHYMALLRSDEYMNTLRGTLNALHDFRAARAEYFMDVLQNFPVPTNRDMDELYKDLHQLKRRVRELERKVKRNGT